jgi:TatD DNase family protein
MLDAHCHIDLYPDPTQTALEADRTGVFVVCVTNMPSAYMAAEPHIRQFKKIRLALGLHPQIAEKHTDQELSLFKDLAHSTSFIGEIGLDFSRDGIKTRDKQLVFFRFALQCLGNKPKFVTLHSRGAESAVLEVLDQEYPHPVVFHWYSGALKHLENAIAAGHFFSINPAMIRNDKGKNIIARIPRDRILTESDGPFIKILNRTIEPSDVLTVEEELGKIWNTEPLAARRIVRKNFQTLIEPLKTPTAARTSDSRLH